MIIAFTTVGDWLRNAFLPFVLIMLGAMLLVRLARWVAARYESAIEVRIRHAIDEGDVASERAKHARALVQALDWTFVAVVFVVAGALATHALGVPFATLLAPATVAGVAIGFGAQQVVGDLLAGFFLFAEHQFGFGDVIRLSQPGQLSGVTGTVEELTLRITKIRTAQGEVVMVPNGALRQVTNLSKEWSRAVVDVPVSVGEDLDAATRVLRAAAQAMADEATWRVMVLGDPVVAGVETYEVGLVRLRVVARTLPGRQFDVARELRLRCATALTASGIKSPPIMPTVQGTM